MSIKTAWELKAGDVIQIGEAWEPLGSVQRMRWSGEFEGRRYQDAPMVKAVFARAPTAFVLSPGDRLYRVRTREKGYKT